ncbi:MAG: hypothetical protein AAF721_04110 [Myxococcota bacterium]
MGWDRPRIFGALLLLAGCRNEVGDGATGFGADSGPPPGADTGHADPEGDTTSEPGEGESGDDDTGTPAADLLFLEVTPGDRVVELDLGQPATADFIVTGHYSDGSVLDVSEAATWTVDNPEVGTMQAATLSIPAHDEVFFSAGIVTAQVGEIDGDAQITVAAYRQSGPQPDFFFVLPFEDPSGAQSRPLTFSTQVKSMDVFFNMDQTISMAGPINRLSGALLDSIIPAVDATVPDAQFGVGTFEDFPIDPYGNDPCLWDPEPDQPFTLLEPVTDDGPAVQAAIEAMIGPHGFPLGCGGDIPESGFEALYQIATGEGLNGPGATDVPAHHDGIGGVGFREGSMPVIVHMTDAMTHDPGADGNDDGCMSSDGGTRPYDDPEVATVAHSGTDALEAMGDICARVIAVVNHEGDCSPAADGVVLNEGTQTLVPPEAWDVAGRPPGCDVGQCCTGDEGTGRPPDAQGRCPLTYLAPSVGEGVEHAITAGLQMVARYVPFSVTSAVVGQAADVRDEPLPRGVTTADFLEAVTPDAHGPVPLPGVADPTLGPVAFHDVIPDTDVTFAILAHNDVVPQGPAPRMFTAAIRVLADDCGALDERQVLILVPPAPLPPAG